MRTVRLRDSRYTSCGCDKAPVDSSPGAHGRTSLILKGSVRNVSDYLQKSQIYVMTSHRESLPMCLLEAKVHRLPCVAFDVPTGPAELIADGTNGYLIPAFACDKMEEKISRLIEDAELRERFSLNAEHGMEKYWPDFILAQWNQVIEQVVCQQNKRIFAS